MIDYSLFKKIYYSGDTNLFRGGIPSFQIKVRAFFEESEIEKTLFIFIGKSLKQIKLYYETASGCWLATYKMRKGKFIAPNGIDTVKINIQQLKWIIEGFNFTTKQTNGS